MDNAMYNIYYIVIYKKMLLKSVVINLKYLKNKSVEFMGPILPLYFLNFPLEDYLKLNAKYLRCGNCLC